MTKLNELQEILTNIQISKALELNAPYITTLSKRWLSKKILKSLENLNYIETSETEHYKKTLIIEHK